VIYQQIAFALVLTIFAIGQSSPDPKMKAAVRDWSAHRGLPGLPSLQKPVFVIKGSPLCSSGGALLNPNRAAVIWTGACALATRDMRVSVLVPTDMRTYLEDHYSQIVEVSWRSANISDGNVYRGWTFIASLKNAGAKALAKSRTGK
jgi:hypothetical protein